MTEAHKKQVMDILNYYIENSYAAYFEKKLPYEFFGKFFEIIEEYPAYVINDISTGKMLGFCFLKAYNPWTVFKHTAEITFFR